MLGEQILNFRTSDVVFVEYNRSAVKPESTAINTGNNDSLKSNYSCSHQHLKALECRYTFIY